MFLSFNQIWLIKLFPADFCKSKENTPITVFKADQIISLLKSLLVYLKANNNSGLICDIKIM